MPWVYAGTTPQRTSTMRFNSLGAWVLTVMACVQTITSSHAQPTPPATPTKPLVLLISLDGFKPAYLSPHNTPNLYRLAQQGAHAKGLISAFPSLTFPNHLTLVTGQTPDHHGIVNNNMTDAATSQRFSLGSREAVENPFWWQEARPIWVSLRQQGKIASTLFWPGSEATIQGLTPNDWLRYNHDMSHDDRLQTLMGWLQRPEDQRPDFATLYFSDVDSAGHRAGPDSEAVQLAAHKVDRSLGLLWEALETNNLLAHTTVVVVSDHGMALAPEDKVIQVKSLLSQFPAAKWEWLGPTAGVRLNGESSQDVLQALSRLAHVSCWPKGQMPQRFNFGTHRRIPDIVCLSEVGYSVSDNPERASPLGQHGYDPEHVDMHGILMVIGPKIRQVQLGLVPNTEVYGLLTQLLGIRAEPHDGQGRLGQQIIRP